ncbi:hypothetical protein HK16_08810 [Acetobacter senegalensis]|uniref:Uncharacterized protein n=2 Tax=Acetobacter TaxID=434 RepID=A0A252EJN7_9PROT|nr:MULTISPECIES: MbcA/ParS/Xre antitoxin family protein [Acetobacter]ATJ90649.1 DUF2384 domain-containing protein [Acetobacter tropicalis]OUL66671.1 hypothetical protein HK16_08810 [Acetobacter senegalensis]
MQPVTKSAPAGGASGIALKAVSRIMTEWNVSTAQAARLCDMSESTWKRARKPGFSGELTHDQMLRLSALVGIYKSLKLYFDDALAAKWMMLPNTGPLFDGMRPVDALIEFGLPYFIDVRRYLDALRGGM